MIGSFANELFLIKSPVYYTILRNGLLLYVKRNSFINRNANIPEN